MADQPFTPDGHKYDPQNPRTIGECWLASGDYPKLQAYANDPLTADFVDQYIIDACAFINSRCGRYLNYQLIDQIFINQAVWMRDYTTFVLDNIPLISVENVWLQIAQTFAEVNQQFFQLDTFAGIVKVLPQFSVYSQVAFPTFRTTASSNVWIRYYAGFTRETVPADLKRATALAVDYLFGLDTITPNVRVLQTQTYKESAASMKDDPILTRIDSMIKPYVLTTLVS